jgi:hypothetical protein
MVAVFPVIVSGTFDRRLLGIQGLTDCSGEERNFLSLPRIKP